MNILFVYYNLQYPLRATLSVGVDAFRLYSGHRVFMWNAALRHNLGFLRHVRFDLVIFSTIYLSQHWGGADHFTRITQRLQDVKRLDAVKVALPQDEFFCADLYSEFCNEFHIDAIYSVAEEETWPLIYRRLTYSPRFYRVLTGYIDERQVYLRPTGGRRIDIGYRAIGKPTPAYGAFGFRKWAIAERFRETCRKRPLTLDISTEDRDKLVGDAWYRFLADCKYVIGVEGASSVVDHDGSVTRAIRDFLRDHPEASFETVAQACLSGIDGKIIIRCLSPRHLEACLTGTCQILIEGDYNGILKPWKHYIPLKSDFSDIEKVLDIVEQDDKREEIVANAWRDIVESEKYTYRSFVSYVLKTAMAGRRLHEVSGPQKRGESLAYRWNSFLDGAGWFLVRIAIAPGYRLVTPLRKLLARSAVMRSLFRTVRTRFG